MSLCPSVLVTRRYSVETAKHVLTLFFTMRCHTILAVPNSKTVRNIPTGSPKGEGVECRGYEKSRLSANISLYLENDTRYSRVIYLIWNGNSRKPSFQTVPFSMTFSDLAKYSMTRSIARSLCDS